MDYFTIYYGGLVLMVLIIIMGSILNVVKLNDVLVLLIATSFWPISYPVLIVAILIVNYVERSKKA